MAERITHHCDKCDAQVHFNVGGTGYKIMKFDIEISGFAKTGIDSGIRGNEAEVLFCNPCFEEIERVLIDHFDLEFDSGE